ncbi:hypothetical protein ZHAS_00016460 [Anopheles sinensis]|uniref:Uncharacterized protein n=1 Tax=Anopheles sinensis TaxID=74873 RepID=A0A084WE31_ANOSI|nr:hypothetical protein ZHAS_00016460 [Anopheles sinensis]
MSQHRAVQRLERQQTTTIRPKNDGAKAFMPVHAGRQSFPMAKLSCNIVQWQMERNIGHLEGEKLSINRGSGFRKPSVPLEHPRNPQDRT